MKILVGADPELFVKNPNNGLFVSGHDMIQGTKKKPFPVKLGAVQVDGTALEFNIDPAATADEFVLNINTVREQLTAMVPGYTIVTEPVAVYDFDYFMNQVPENAKELGCDPDYNGWTGTTNPRPDAGMSPFRTASGHIHIGWTTGAKPRSKDHFQLCCEMAKQLDYYLGIQSLLWDPDNTRRELYGKAGAFRPKSYGMEYRVMSNRWLSSQLLIRWVYQAAIAGTQAFFNGNRPANFHGDLAQKIIDNNELGWQAHLSLEDFDIPALPVGAFTKLAA